MKHSIAMTSRFVPIVILALLVTNQAIADIYTLSVSALAPQSNVRVTNSQTFIVPSNITAQVLSGYCTELFINSPGAANGAPSATLTVATNSQPIFLATSGAGSTEGPFVYLPTVAGPATITLTVQSDSSTNENFITYCTIQTSPSSSANTNFVTFVPSTAVVIPADNGGPVNIILESSVDLVNWTAALPGTYGTTSTNRFFRVRAQR